MKYVFIPFSSADETVISEDQDVVFTAKMASKDGGQIRRIIVCQFCGEELVCYGFTNECDCGELYNMNGTHLRPRHQWEEDY